MVKCNDLICNYNTDGVCKGEIELEFDENGVINNFECNHEVSTIDYIN